MSPPPVLAVARPTGRPASRLDPVALLIRHVLFPAWIRKNRSARLRYLEELEKTQFLPANVLAEMQWSRFKALLTHAFEHCPFYRRQMSAVGLTPDSIRTPADIGRLPTVSKEEIQESMRDLIADNFTDRPLLKDMTGGSTGSPMVFYYDDDRLDSRVAATIRHNRWTGWEIGNKMALLWGAPRDTAGAPSLKARLRDWILDRRVILDASAIDDRRMRDFCRHLERHQPRFILAYANTLALFARFVRDEGLNPLRPHAIICSGEVLTAESRSLIESTFGCRVFNRYGSREFAVIASECDAHQGLHISAENLLVEVLVNGVPTTDQDGEIVITDLTNFAMPLIRYRTRDMGRLEMRACRCGRGLPLLHLTGGRTTDFLTGINGQKVSGIVLATYGITGIPGVRQIQFVQDRLESVTVRVVRGPEWSEESLRTLTSRVRSFLGESMALETEFADHIPLEPSGKYRFSISRLPQV